MHRTCYTTHFECVDLGKSKDFIHDTTMVWPSLVHFSATYGRARSVGDVTVRNRVLRQILGIHVVYSTQLGEEWDVC